MPIIYYKWADRTTCREQHRGQSDSLCLEESAQIIKDEV